MHLKWDCNTDISFKLYWKWQNKSTHDNNNKKKKKKKKKNTATTHIMILKSWKDCINKI